MNDAEKKLEKVLAYIENADMKLQKRVRDLRDYKMFELADKYDRVREELENIRWIIEEDD